MKKLLTIIGTGGFFAVLGVLVLALIFGFSWGVTVGIIWLVCKCFGWTFSLLIATGIWLVLLLLKSVFERS